MDFVDYSSQAAFQNAAEDVRERGSQHHQQFAQPTASSMLDPPKQAFYNAGLQHQVSCDIKPRLTKEQHDVLENHYLQQPKPNTNTKKGFAESLGVSLDKVNNWFQNRRAKSKQDAKKAQGALNLLHHQQAQHYNFNSGSDSEVSPAYPTTDFMSAMNQYAPDDQPLNGLGIHPMQQLSEQGYFSNMPEEASEHFQQNFHMHHQQTPQEMFDSPQEVNRRTLTQEQFDAFAQNGHMSNDFDVFQSGFSGNQDVFNQVFPELQNTQFKQQDVFAFPHSVPAPLSSLDSTVPSTVSEHSVNMFPSSTSSMQDQSNMSSSSSEWADSRSSSVSVGAPDDTSFMHTPAHQRQTPAASTSQWQPGTSVPVDFTALNEQFRQAAAHAQGRPSPQIHEQPLAWPADEAFVRRDSQTSNMLAQSMSNVGIHTPQPQHTATFKSPAPPASIAARRQRPRPAALGLASLRSQSYSGAAGPGSPGQSQQAHSLTPGAQPLRRIRSSNVMNGVSQGRVQKPIPGSAQRSPLAWTFADGINSPKAVRHVSSQSSGNLAPPTPMSPGNEFPRPEQSRASFSSWQNASSRQPSISETDVEHGAPYMPNNNAPLHNFSSPPHTPMYHQQSFVQQRIGNHIAENTPPQSAPASQQCFPTSTFSVPQPPMQHQVQPQMSQAPMQAFVPAPQQQMMNVIVPEQQVHAPNVTFAPAQQFVAPTSAVPAELPMQFANGVPIVDAQGQLRMAFPPQMQHFMQQGPPPQAQMHTPPQGQFQMFSTAAPSPSMHVTAHLPKQPPQPAAELFVHEYSPPQEIKRTATPRKAVDTGPKNYTFANQGPEHFGKDKGKKDSKASTIVSHSPASSSSS